MKPSYVFLGYSAPWVAMCLDAIGEVSNPICVLNQQCNLDHPVADRLIIVSETEWTAQPSDLLILGVGRTRTKQAVSTAFDERIHPGAIFPTVRARESSVSSTAVLGAGVIVQAGAVIGPYAVLEDFVTMNRASTVGHDTRVGKFSSINPGAHIAGQCHVGSGVTIGMGALVFDGCKIGDNSVIGGGAVVTSDIPDGVVAVGTPAKVIRDV